jgi:hypothetical protein
MSEHMTEWLGPYLDGELDGIRKQQVETHLASCAGCRSELQSLRNLSELLKNDPEQPAPSTDKFVARLALNLPRRLEAVSPRRAWPLNWWLVPAGITSIWIVLLILSTLVDVAVLLKGSGLAGTTFNWLHLPSETAWFSASMGLFGSHLGAGSKTALDFLNELDLFVENFTVRLGWQASLAVLYWTWLVTGWVRYRSLVIGKPRPKYPRFSIQA